ncbi:hypothetical protein OUZ56_025514 [Daphnia magna]|uniref:Uncharacterized protein n=1 Tax=Daphnia magna TaxID=35525 RepID=A0ABQ9ZK21_9CRUS|nr:hypothetical protein OUZ56_025514 [Daphnia magna]
MTLTTSSLKLQMETHTPVCGSGQSCGDGLPNMLTVSNDLRSDLQHIMLLPRCVHQMSGFPMYRVRYSRFNRLFAVSAYLFKPTKSVMPRTKIGFMQWSIVSMLMVQHLLG